MTDSVAQRLASLSAQLRGLEAAATDLAGDPSLGISVRRIARSLESSARSLDLQEIEAGAIAIQRAADAHLPRSVSNFLARVEELRSDGSVEEATILVVEDDRTVATATRAFVKGPGRTITVAESAAEALSVLETRDVDVVILDLILPDRDGRDVLVQMREQASTSTVPVVVLSSTAGAVARAECMAVGADEFIEKPADPESLRAAVARQIENGRRRRDAVRDGLTGLPNRAGIRAEFEERQRAAGESGRPLCVAIIRLDSLPQITMKLGRDAGERFLLEVTSALCDALGARDRLGRWETTELVAVLPDRTPSEAKGILEASIRALADDEALEEIVGAGIEISLSGGVAPVEPKQSLREAISSAERSLYGARASESDTVRSDEDPLELELRRVLLVEDDGVTATLIRHRLVRDGHEVVAFANGEEAHAWAGENDFDLAILDVKVPGMDGFELLAKLRAIARYADVPIIMLTGMGSEGDVVRGLELGADDYMLKPFSPSELLARVRRLLHAHAEARPGSTRPPSTGTTRSATGREGTAPGDAAETHPGNGLEPPREARA